MSTPIKELIACFEETGPELTVPQVLDRLRVIEGQLAEQPAPQVVDCHATGVCVQSGLRAAQPEQPEQQQNPLDGQRNLVEILAENWRVWPARKVVEQTSLGDVYCSVKGRDLMFGNHEIASDQGSAVVTKEMWSAMREALASKAKEQPAQQQLEPYGQVTVVRRPGCVDQHWFYRWPELPYLDNAAECHTVYTSPPAQRKPLTNTEFGEAWFKYTARILGADKQLLLQAKRVTEAAHGIKENT